MDRRHLEPGAWLHENLSGVQALLRGDVRGAISRRPGHPFEHGLDLRAPSTVANTSVCSGDGTRRSPPALVPVNAPTTKKKGTFADPKLRVQFS